MESAKVLQTFQANHGYPLPSDDTIKSGSLTALSEFGRSYRLGQQVLRYFDLKAKVARTSEENQRFNQLSASLDQEIPGFDSTIAVE